MKPAAILLVLVAALACAQSMQAALAVPDNIYIAVPPGNSSSITLVLPDDSGWIGSGTVSYNITVTPEPFRTWSDLTEQSFVTDENNTIQVPVSFTRKSAGSCGERFTLTIESSKGTRRVITGGACESLHTGVSTAPAPPSQPVGEALNQNFGIFDIAFGDQNFFAMPGEVVNVTAMAGSYQDNANIHVALAAGLQSVSPSGYDVDLGASGGQRTLSFQVQAPDAEGSYGLALTGRLRGCSTDACAITKHASLVVGSHDSGVGYGLSLFPESISSAEGRPATFRLSIDNRDLPRQFDISMLLPIGVGSTFNDTSLSIAAGQQGFVDFNLTPSRLSDSYQFTLNVRSGGEVKPITGYLNVDGMGAGAARALEFVQESGSQGQINQASAALQGFNSNPSLNSYGSLQDELARLAANNTRQNATPATGGSVDAGNYTYVPPTSAQPAGIDIMGKDIWILVLVAGAGLVLSLALHFRKPGSGRALGEEFNGAKL